MRAIVKRTLHCFTLDAIFGSVMLETLFDETPFGGRSFFEISNGLTMPSGIFPFNENAEKVSTFVILLADCVKQLFTT